MSEQNLPKPPLLQPPATPAAGSTTTFEGSIALSVAGHTYTLTGTLGDALIVEYHADFDQAISLGLVGDIAPAIATAMNFPDLAVEITDALKTVSTLPVIGPLGSIFLTATARITDLEINTQTSTYGVGLALDFTTSTPLPELPGVNIALLAIGFKVTKVKAASTTPTPTPTPAPAPAPAP